jgi:transcriptional regulator
MMLKEQAQELLDSDAPISSTKTDIRYQFVYLRAKGMTNFEIASNLNTTLDRIEETEEDIISEFLK